MRFRQSRGTDDGFSLAEVLVALGFVTVVLLALLTSSLFSVRATLDGRQNQQAGDYLNRAIETVRSMEYGAVTMNTPDLAGDSRIVQVGGVSTYDPGTGPEKIDATAVGDVTPHIETANTSNGRYTTRRYITVPALTPTDAQGIPAVRRLTVEVSWTTRGISHTRKAGTLITNTRRGLPLPNYTFAYHGPATLVAGQATWVKNPGNSVDYGLVLNNLGARDSWSLSASTPGWSFYLDTDKDGLWSGDAVVEPLLTPPDTGLIDPGSVPRYVVAHRVVQSSEFGTTTTVFSALSDAQPAVTAKTVTTKLTVQNGAVVIPSATASPSATPTPTATPSTPPCTPGTATGVSGSTAAPGASTQNSYTLTSLYALNGSTAGDTATIPQVSFGKDSAVLQSNVCNYSTDQQTNQAGRYLAAGGAAPNGRAEFQFQPPSGADDEVRGNPAVMVLYVQCPGTLPVLTVTLGSLSGTTYSQQALSTVTPTGCSASGFLRVDVPLNTAGNGFTVSTSGRAVVRVTTTQPVRLLYGTASAPSRLVVGLK